MILEKLGQNAMALDTFTNLSHREAALTEAELRRLLAKAMWRKGRLLEELNRPNEALDVYHHLVDRFQADTHAGTREAVDLARTRIDALRDSGKRSRPIAKTRTKRRPPAKKKASRTKTNSSPKRRRPI
jgi:hypothetical protein